MKIERSNQEATKLQILLIEQHYVEKLEDDEPIQIKANPSDAYFEYCVFSEHLCSPMNFMNTHYRKKRRNSIKVEQPVAEQNKRNRNTQALNIQGQYTQSSKIPKI